ncbi:hypothetical protein FOMA001_g20251 [Fusarium oxysporum f. sp. matthiolae]|nr:hypothetical protein FOMA001_g20251 [Fusarium oxysporum f. sp. matthiolae]
MEYFTYESEFRLLCYRICQTMVTQKQVKLHLRSAPHSLNIQEIRLAQEWASKHDVFEGQVEAHVNLPPRPDDAPPIAALGPPGTGGIRSALQRAIDAFQSKGKDIRSREAERIDEENDFTAPNPWLRRLGSAVHLKDFSGKKDFLRGLIAMEYEVDPDDPGKLVNHAKAVITPDVVSWNALFEVNRKELTKERTKPFHFRFKPETQRRYALVVKQLLAYIVRCMSFEDKADRPPFKLSIRQQSAYDIMMEHADDLTDAWKENGVIQKRPRLSDFLIY